MRFILLDQLTELVPGERASARKKFDGGEQFFQDHFPGNPVVPGVLLTEAMSQTAGWLVLVTVRFERFPMLAMVRSAKFRRHASPGDDLRISAVIESVAEDSSIVKTEVRCGDDRIADATVVFHHFPLESLASQRLRDWTQATFAQLGGGELLAKADR